MAARQLAGVTTAVLKGEQDRRWCCCTALPSSVQSGCRYCGNWFDLIG